MTFGCGGCMAIFSKVEIGCQGKRSKLWYGDHDYENKLSYLEMKK